MEGNQSSVIESSDGDIKKLMANAVLESTKNTLKYADNEYTFSIYSYVNLNRFIKKKKKI